MTDRKRRKPGRYGYGGAYGGGYYGMSTMWGSRDPDDPGDLTMTSNLGEQFDGYSDGGGGDGGGGGE